MTLHSLSRERLMLHIVTQAMMVVFHCAALLWFVLAATGLGYDLLASASAPLRVLAWFWTIGGLGWAAGNTLGLIRRRGWAYRSTLAYWVVPSAFWCCIPIPLWAIWKLTRRG